MHTELSSEVVTRDATALDSGGRVLESELYVESETKYSGGIAQKYVTFGPLLDALNAAARTPLDESRSISEVEQNLCEFIEQLESEATDDTVREQFAEVRHAVTNRLSGEPSLLLEIRREYGRVALDVREREPLWSSPNDSVSYAMDSFETDSTPCTSARTEALLRSFANSVYDKNVHPRKNQHMFLRVEQRGEEVEVELSMFWSAKPMRVVSVLRSANRAVGLVRRKIGSVAHRLSVKMRSNE